MNPSMFKAYDIRGIYPQDINENNFPDIIKAIYSFFLKASGQEKLSVVLGRDMRISGPSLFEVAKKTLVECGATVIDIGLASTPTVYYCVKKYGYGAGIQVSASHNPSQWNGCKFFMMKGNRIMKVSKAWGMEEIKKRAIEKDFVDFKGMGKVEIRQGVLEQEVKDAIDTIKPDNKKKLKVVCDAANGMGSLYVSEIFRQYSADLTKLYFDLDGTFPNHQPDPLQFELWEELRHRVVKEKADFGIAPDGDGDRIFFVDEKGKTIPATMITSLISQEILSKNPGQTVVADIRYTLNARNVIEKLGGKFSVSPVGHALITKQLNEEDAVFAGESSGHFYFRDTGGAESSIRVILYVIKLLQETGKPLSEIVRKYKSSEESGEYNFILPPDKDAKELLKSIESELSAGKSSHLDGLAIDFPDWRLNIRTSNTEPLLRLNVEGSGDSLVKEKLKMLTDRIIAFGGKAKNAGH